MGDLPWEDRGALPWCEFGGIPCPPYLFMKSLTLEISVLPCSMSTAPESESPGPLMFPGRFLGLNPNLWNQNPRAWPSNLPSGAHWNVGTVPCSLAVRGQGPSPRLAEGMRAGVRRQACTPLALHSGRILVRGSGRWRGGRT